MYLEHIAFLGRTFDEYLDMFGLKEEDLKGERLLDCPAGPSSFTAEATAKGISATASDPAFSLSNDEIAKRIEDDMAHVFDALEKVKDNYVWNYYSDKDEVISLRKKAAGIFLNDLNEGRKAGRYISEGLPTLPFKDDEFTMTLSGHFLFLYSQWLSIDDHLNYLRELLRVTSREVRVYPLITLEADKYDYLGYILSTLADEGIISEIDSVKLEFLKGSNRMLRLIHK
jgi:hypothetical protein